MGDATATGIGCGQWDEIEAGPEGEGEEVVGGGGGSGGISWSLVPRPLDRGYFPPSVLTYQQFTPIRRTRERCLQPQGSRSASLRGSALG